MFSFHLRDLEINKLRKIGEVIFSSDKAKNVAIAKATASLPDGKGRAF
jgi:hypothetical protein